MAARAGVTRSDVIAAAVQLTEESGRLDAVTLGAVARRLGIRPQSLYAHVDGADGLRRALAVAALDALAGEVVRASIGVSGLAAVDAIVRAHLAFARERPGVYEAAIHPPGDDPELLAAVASVSAPLEIVLTSMGLGQADVVHWTRLVLSSVYGYAALHRSGSFTLRADTATTEDRLVAMLTMQLAVQPA